ncbi:MAG TPA: hypothetical protein VFP20_07230 [Bacteroidales bacterium]|nr:hypothetical protein [Bacteroidales bacterium]
MKTKLLFIAFLVISSLTFAIKKPERFTSYTIGEDKIGTALMLQFEKGKQHNHPLFAVWLADTNGTFLETLYVSQSIGTGVFPKADHSKGSWMAGSIQRPAALPYWAHQRNILNEFGNYNPTPAHPEMDGNTGATPSASFVLNLKTAQKRVGKFIVFVELNQSWDWNEFWYNDRFPGNKEYMTSSQPALVYSAFIDTREKKAYTMSPIGHSHYSGADGSLNPDLSSLTTALRIAKNITVIVP